MSARGLLPPGNTFYQMKSRDTFAPMGPWIVTADEISDPQSLPIKLWVNGELKQDFNSDDIGDACDGIGITETIANKKLVKIIDLLGRETVKEGLQLYIYNN